MNLMYQFIALVIWLAFVCWLTGEVDAKRYKYNRKDYKISRKITTSIVIGKITSKGLSHNNLQTND